MACRVPAGRPWHASSLVSATGSAALLCTARLGTSDQCPSEWRVEQASKAPRPSRRVPRAGVAGDGDGVSFPVNVKPCKPPGR